MCSQLIGIDPTIEGAVWFALDKVVAYQRTDKKIDAQMFRDILAMTAAACDRREAKRRRDAAIVRVWTLMGESTTPGMVAQVLARFERENWPRCSLAGLPDDVTDLSRAIHDVFRYAAVIRKVNGGLEIPRSIKQIKRILGHRAI